MHYAGVGCEMDDHHGDRASGMASTVVEDNAHGLYGRYEAACSARLEPLATQSFHETKNVSCGEGGALLINDPAVIERAEIHSGEGNQSEPILPGRGGQVHLGRCRVELSALGSAAPRSFARSSRPSSRSRPGVVASGQRYHGELKAGPCRTASDSPSFPTIASSRTTCIIAPALPGAEAGIHRAPLGSRCHERLSLCAIASLAHGSAASAATRGMPSDGRRGRQVGSPAFFYDLSRGRSSSGD